LVLALTSVSASLARAQEVEPGGETGSPQPVATVPRTADVPRTPADVVAMLSGFEGAPRESEWRAIGPSAIPLLRTVASDTRLPGFVRLRAVQALGAFATPEVRDQLRRMLRGAEPLLAREAGLSLARAFGAAAEGDVASLLAHDDVAVREGAIDALARIGTASARTRLERQLGRERDVALRERIADRLRGVVGASPDGEGTR